MKTTLTTLCALGLLCFDASLNAQNVLAYRPETGAAVPARMFEYPCRSPAWGPAGGPGLVPGFYPGRVRPLAGHPLGAVAVDAREHIVFTTNGVNTIQRTEYPRVGSSAGSSLSNLPIPAAVGIVYGMAVDPDLRRIFLTDGTTIFECDPLAGMAVLTSWPAAPLNILTGLDFDPTQPSLLFAVSSAGEVATYNRGGGIVAVVAPTYPWPGSQATGLALDLSDAAGSMVYVVHANGEVYNHTLGVLHATLPIDEVGLAFLASPIQLPSACVCGGAAPAVGVADLLLADSPGFALTIDGLPISTPFVAWGIELPGGPALAPIGVPFACGDTLWLDPVTPPGMVLLTAIVTGTSSTLSLPLPASAGGMRLFAQPLVPCAVSPCGFVLANAMQLEIARD